jgi:dCTP deaminase
MVLSRKDIETRIRSRELNFVPMLDGFQMQPHAVDLRLGFEFHIPKTWEITSEGRKAITIDPLLADGNGRNFDKVTLKPGQYFELLPEEQVIGTTLEKIELIGADLMCVLYPRSSINRRGLSVDLSGIVDVGYKGHLMIPVVNNTQKQVIRIYPGERICQLVFQTLSSKVPSKQVSMHGLTKAKYDNVGKAFSGSKSDRSDELRLVKSGALKKLKKIYAISF